MNGLFQKYSSNTILSENKEICVLYMCHLLVLYLIYFKVTLYVTCVAYVYIRSKLILNAWWSQKLIPNIGALKEALALKAVVTEINITNNY